MTRVPPPHRAAPAVGGAGAAVRAGATAAIEPTGLEEVAGPIAPRRAGVPDPDGGGLDFVLGIDVGGTKVAVATAARDGRVLRRTRIDTDASRGALQTVERALDTAERLRAETSAETGGRCLGAGVASPGVVHEDRVLMAPNIPGWGELSLPALVREHLDIAEVAAANDVKAAGLAEARWGALRGVDPGIYLNLGTGLAAALVVGGRVLGGAHNAAGEIGYLLRGPHDTAGAASDRAPLEEYFSGMGLARRGAELLGGSPTAADLFGSTEPRVRELVDEALDQLAVHVANLATTLDPQRIAVGGGMMRSAERIFPVLRARLGEAVPFPPELVPSAYPNDSALHGALALILDALGLPATLTDEVA
ncbi:ROK family protein [Streptomyces sp. TS71-3]|uniref:ROK family protein n=1 Tax=Streptomyces sp. TS71-3 TaxID=2733862 RepID=UPI001B2F0DC3|nr:ROK family protein [Streptomyces sp. TS71-3]GHJ36701.1 glucokinase [Streptomyces sp. TS71-3]